MGDRMTKPEYRFLRSSRRLPLLPHRLMAPLVEFVHELAEVAHAVGVELADERWTRAGDALERAADLLRDAAR